MGNNQDYIIDLLNEFVFFGKLREDETIRIAQHSNIVSFKKNETIVKQGTPAQNTLLLSKGMVKKQVEVCPGKNRIAELIKAPAIASLLMVFNKSPYPYSLSSIKTSEILFIDMDMIHKLVRSNTRFANAILLYNSRTYREVLRQQMLLASLPMHTKITKALLWLSEGREEYILPISQKELADYIQVTPENVSSLFREMKENGQAQIERGIIKIITGRLELGQSS